jgi:hypothetical protein
MVMWFFNESDVSNLKLFAVRRAFYIDDNYGMDQYIRK